jgi:hypothetical protein
MKIQPQNSKSNCQQKRLFSRIVLSRVVWTLKISLIDFKYRKYEVLSVLGNMTSLHIFVKICVDHTLTIKGPLPTDLNYLKNAESEHLIR